MWQGTHRLYSRLTFLLSLTHCALNPDLVPHVCSFQATERLALLVGHVPGRVHILQLEAISVDDVAQAEQVDVLRHLKAPRVLGGSLFGRRLAYGSVFEHPHLNFPPKKLLQHVYCMEHRRAQAC